MDQSKPKPCVNCFKTHKFWAMNNLLIINNATDSLIYSFIAHLSMYKHPETLITSYLKTILYSLRAIDWDLYAQAFSNQRFKTHTLPFTKGLFLPVFIF